jgi:hypothetical protein
MSKITCIFCKKPVYQILVMVFLDYLLLFVRMALAL